MSLLLNNVKMAKFRKNKQIKVVSTANEEIGKINSRELIERLRAETERKVLKEKGNFRLEHLVIDPSFIKLDSSDRGILNYRINGKVSVLDEETEEVSDIPISVVASLKELENQKFTELGNQLLNELDDNFSKTKPMWESIIPILYHTEGTEFERLTSISYDSLFDYAEHLYKSQLLRPEALIINIDNSEHSIKSKGRGKNRKINISGSLKYYTEEREQIDGDISLELPFTNLSDINKELVEKYNIEALQEQKRFSERFLLPLYNSAGNLGKRIKSKFTKRNKTERAPETDIAINKDHRYSNLGRNLLLGATGLALLFGGIYYGKYLCGEEKAQERYESTSHVSRQDESEKESSTVELQQTRNKAPISKSGNNRTVNVRDIVVLDDKGSYDPDGKIIAYNWVVKDKNKKPIKNYENEKEAYYLPNTVGILYAELRVTDNQDKSSSSEIKITVNEPSAKPVEKTVIVEKSKSKKITEKKDSSKKSEAVEARKDLNKVKVKTSDKHSEDTEKIENKKPLLIAEILTGDVVKLGESVKVRASDSYEPNDSSPVTCSWTFAPGHRYSGGCDLKFLYETYGEKTIDLVVTDNDGEEASKRFYVKVIDTNKESESEERDNENYEPPNKFKSRVKEKNRIKESESEETQIDGTEGEIPDSPVNEPPIGIINDDENSIDAYVNEPVKLNCLNSEDPDGGYIESCEWVFGDGNNEFGKKVTHTYKKAGKYTVQLIPTDNEGSQPPEDVTLEVMVRERSTEDNKPLQNKENRDEDYTEIVPKPRPKTYEDIHSGLKYISGDKATLIREYKLALYGIFKDNCSDVTSGYIRFTYVIEDKIVRAVSLLESNIPKDCAKEIVDYVDGKRLRSEYNNKNPDGIYRTTLSFEIKRADSKKTGD